MALESGLVEGVHGWHDGQQGFRGRQWFARDCGRYLIPETFGELGFRQVKSGVYLEQGNGQRSL